MKIKQPKQIYSETYVKATNPVNIPLLSQLLEEGRVSGYVMKEGELDNGDQFVQVYFIIKQEQK